MAELVAYLLALLLPLKDTRGVKLVEELSDQHMEIRLNDRTLPAVILTPAGESFGTGDFGNTRRRFMSVRIRVMDKRPAEKSMEYPRSIDNVNNVSAISDEIQRLIAVDKGQQLTAGSPYLWAIDPTPRLTDFDAWPGKPGQWSGRDYIMSASRHEAWDGPENTQDSFALPG